jgi:acetylornithine deacetylase/succinyl-diaminopimelate desuccinylase-like protein|tara:strand:+ start:6210 stop:7598 length:1389 start_codon:yes stop_codon:yes gene_type:complete
MNLQRRIGCIIFSLLPSITSAADLGGTQLADEGVRTLIRYLQVDTTNPPGNEDRGVSFFADIFKEEGIRYKTAEAAPTRGNIWARLKGGDKPALVLLNHMDVVPADASYWLEDPLSGAERDGKIYGRGALDMKGTGILQLQAFLALHRSGQSLNRDVIFVATADEEAGGNFGAAYLAKEHAEIFEGVGYLLNEGGGGGFANNRPIFTVGVTEKIPFWLKLTATGNPGHGSTPQVETSVTKLLRALSRLDNARFEPRVIPVMNNYLGSIANMQTAYLKQKFSDMESAVKDRNFLLRLQLENPGLAARLRNSCSITRLGASNKINVVPPEAWAEIDCRLLPDQDKDEFIEILKATLNEPDIEITPILAFRPAVSPTNTPLYEIVARVIGRHHPDALLVPSMSAGFTDSHWFREMGITSYGFVPTLVPIGDYGGVHGNNERMDIDAFKKGTMLLLEIVQQFVYDG